MTPQLAGVSTNSTRSQIHPLQRIQRLIIVPVTDDAYTGGVRFAYLGDEGSIRNFNHIGM